MSSLRRPSLLLLGLLALSACATRPPASEPEALAEFEQNNDPFEPFNRAMYAVNTGIDDVVLRPAAKVYQFAVPQPVRTGVRNVLGNLRTPVIAVNDLLQGEPDRLLVTVGRFMINTTFGLGGIFDVAAATGMPGHTEDFGQTFATWGIGEGPFLFLPILGPTNPRDLVGYGAGVAADPLTWILPDGGPTAEGLGYSRLGLTVVDTREGLLETVDAINETSLDPYATFRSGYRQNRNQQIRNAGELPATAGPLAQPRTGTTAP
ncbi:VacJ family lipoprotein [Pseudoroseomonas wenyumeiae]|uniref:VacJ family lipoprotein n=1 Tax=Teichococcus wenyumeiae TaxID=2478470 RepID=A0A3A9JL64_9PROT|nr:VacJ family lipoprotein [Pseudoroseomonas wenyumeiae]RKK04546.1 VacJ family lipoprotein [Pseudoroseomonas wenyumeiae]RMI20344.1 VacJ family lipoprotein [Pseudoroseomonas wenyumeiae]